MADDIRISGLPQVEDAWNFSLFDAIFNRRSRRFGLGMEIKEGGETRHVPMFTKEVTLEPKLPALAKLLDWVSGIPDAPAAQANNTQVNIDELLLLLDTPLPREAE